MWVLKTIEGSLNANNLGGNHCVTAGTGFTARREAEILGHLEEVPYFLMRDHRIEPPAAGIAVGSTRTEVPFPKGSTDMRVYAFFQRKDDKKWVRYKDKFYSIGRGKKVYTLDATNQCRDCSVPVASPQQRQAAVLLPFRARQAELAMVHILASSWTCQ
ncbi:unnamed protein product [Ectocarpus sp. 8 AP-2014]